MIRHAIAVTLSLAFGAALPAVAGQRVGSDQPSCGDDEKKKDTKQDSASPKRQCGDDEKKKGTKLVAPDYQ
jgi:hypothetical protein